MTDSSIYSQIVEKIIREQETIIGPIALEQAKRVKGLHVDMTKHAVQFKGDESQIIEELVEQYRDFFGQVSVEVCKNAVKKLISQLPKDQQPILLR